MFFVYIIRNEYDDLYIGISENPNRRLAEHNGKRGAQHTKRGTYSIVLVEQYTSLLSARKREIQIKKWRRDKKDALVQKYQRGEETRL